MSRAAPRGAPLRRARKKTRGGRQRLAIEGQVYGRLTVISRAPVPSRGHVYWYCDCECGNNVAVEQSNLRSARTKSCGKGCPLLDKSNFRKGTRQPRKRLTPETVTAIRELGRTEVSQREIAERFGVSRLTVLSILNGRTHKQKEPRRVQQGVAA